MLHVGKWTYIIESPVYLLSVYTYFLYEHHWTMHIFKRKLRSQIEKINMKKDIDFFASVPVIPSN